MISARQEVIWSPLEEPPALVPKLARLAVHQGPGRNDGRAVGKGDRLVAEADPQDGQLPREGHIDLDGQAGVLGATGAGREDEMGRFFSQAGFETSRVVADHRHARPECPERLNEVEREGVVVVDEQDAGRSFGR